MKEIENKLFVFDDIIDTQYQENIKNILMGSEKYNGYEFSWFFTEDVTEGVDNELTGSTINLNQKENLIWRKQTQKRPAMSHNFFAKFMTNRGSRISNKVSEFHDLFVPLISQSCSRLMSVLNTEINQINIIQGRSFLQFPLNLKNYDVDTPHIDLSTIDHFVMLYYVCDSDGDTIIYNERVPSDQYTIKKRVSPKQGRVVLFDGGLYHTAEQPLNNNRCIVNYDLE